MFQLTSLCSKFQSYTQKSNFPTQTNYETFSDTHESRHERISFFKYTFISRRSKILNLFFRIISLRYVVRTNAFFFNKLICTLTKWIRTLKSNTINYVLFYKLIWTMSFVKSKIIMIIFLFNNLKVSAHWLFNHYLTTHLSTTRRIVFFKTKIQNLHLLLTGFVLTLINN